MCVFPSQVLLVCGRKSQRGPRRRPLHLVHPTAAQQVVPVRRRSNSFSFRARRFRKWRVCKSNFNIMGLGSSLQTPGLSTLGSHWFGISVIISEMKNAQGKESFFLKVIEVKDFPLKVRDIMSIKNIKLFLRNN